MARHRTRSNPAWQPFANRSRIDCEVPKSVEVVDDLGGAPLGVASWQFPLSTILPEQATEASTAAGCMLEQVKSSLAIGLWDGAARCHMNES